VPKFELFKHNDELLNIYYGIFYELWTFADFDRLCILEKRGSFRQSLVEIGLVVSNKMIFKWFFAYLCLICIIGQNRQKFIKNPIIYVKKLIIMLIQFKFGHIQA
jgi:hypothetical protein